MFDMTDKRTFLHLRDWIDEVHKRTAGTGRKMQMLVIGNKVDLVEDGGR